MLTNQIENILATMPETRNSDKLLLIEYWKQKGLYLTEDQERTFMELKSPESVRRVRQKIQEQGKYLADKKIKQSRDWTAMRMQQIAPTATPKTIEKVMQNSLINIEDTRR